MSDSPDNDDGALPLSIREQIDALCDRFEASWKAGGTPKIEEYLLEVQHSARASLLRELLAVEVEYRRDERGRLASHDAILRAHPEHATAVADELRRLPQPVAAAEDHASGPAEAPEVTRTYERSWPPEIRAQVEELQSHFVDALEAGLRPDIDRLVEGLDEPVRSLVLRELLILRLRYVNSHEDQVAEHVGADPDPILMDGLAAVRLRIQAIDTGRIGRGSTSRDPHPQGTNADKPVEGRERFLPGVVFAGRYRILGLVGKGGMGEVYRADDLVLGQTVALKFLPEFLAKSERSLSFFRNEVRLARRIAHPNVCCVYDIGEVDGQHFLTMEFVDGENLSTLLRRIDRLPYDKGIQVARQICAGLAAAHGLGIIHRDLKPSNIILDGRGHVRITDFGLAHLADDAVMARELAGTPAYMSPEQLGGQPATIRSDIYSLGLILYEILTGQRVWNTNSIQELSKLHQTETPLRPSIVLPEIHSDVENAILRCLAPDPRERPSSSLSVAATFPGSDVLAAVLTAGDTPVPEFVAATGGTGGLRPQLAVVLLLAVVGGLVAGTMLAGNLRTLEKAALVQKPAILEQKASDLLTDFGYGRAYEYFGFHWESEEVKQGRHYDDVDIEHSISFWYRTSPHTLVPPFVLRIASVGERVRYTQPPLEPGMSAVRLDKNGNLIEFLAKPETMPEPVPVSVPDEAWEKMFKASELPMSEFKLTKRDVPEPLIIAADRTIVWERASATRETGETERIRSSALRGQITSWRRIQSPSATGTNGITIGEIIEKLVYLMSIGGGLVFADRNRRQRRCDFKGAFRISLFVFAVYTLDWLVTADHVASIQEVMLLRTALAKSLFWSFSVWVLYLGFEPFIRRQWPRLMISWNRLLEGRWRDPLVGRDILIGCCVGFLAIPALGSLNLVLRKLLGLHWLPAIPPIDGARLATLHLGECCAVSVLCDSACRGVWFSFGLLILLLGLLLIVRRFSVAVLLVFATFTAFLSYYFGDRSPSWSWFLYMGMWVGMALLIEFKLGVLASATSFFVLAALIQLPVTSDMSRWYRDVAVEGQLALVLLAVYGFYTSLAGRPLLREPALSSPR